MSFLTSIFGKTQTQRLKEKEDEISDIEKKYVQLKHVFEKNKFDKKSACEIINELKRLAFTVTKKAEAINKILKIDYLTDIQLLIESNGLGLCIENEEDQYIYLIRWLETVWIHILKNDIKERKNALKNEWVTIPYWLLTSSGH